MVYVQMLMQIILIVILNINKTNLINLRIHHTHIYIQDFSLDLKGLREITYKYIKNIKAFFLF